MTKIVLNSVLLLIVLFFRPHKVVLKAVRYICEYRAMGIGAFFMSTYSDAHAAANEVISGGVDVLLVFITLFLLALLWLYRTLCKSISHKCTIQLYERFGIKS